MELLAVMGIALVIAGVVFSAVDLSLRKFRARMGFDIGIMLAGLFMILMNILART